MCWALTFAALLQVDVPVCNFELILSGMFAFHTLNFSKNQNLQFNQSYTLDDLVRKLHFFFFFLKLDNVEFLLMIC